MSESGYHFDVYQQNDLLQPTSSPDDALSGISLGRQVEKAQTR